MRSWLKITLAFAANPQKICPAIWGRSNLAYPFFTEWNSLVDTFAGDMEAHVWLEQSSPRCVSFSSQLELQLTAGGLSGSKSMIPGVAVDMK